MLNFIAALTLSSLVVANPYPDANLVPKDDPFKKHLPLSAPQVLSPSRISEDGLPVLRVRVDWDASTDKFSVANVVREKSGTTALYARAKTRDPLGSYKGVIRDAVTGEALAYDSIGTGQEFRKLTRAISFRFPFVDKKIRFEMQAENPTTGVLEKVVDVQVTASEIDSDSEAPALIVKRLKQATSEPKLLINIYADGYRQDNQKVFFDDATRAVQALVDHHFPMVDHFEVRAVFSSSVEEIGDPRDLGLPVAERNSALGLYYPYWDNFGRWYNVVYPTREEKFRAAVGRVPYDYAVVVVDSPNYWGIGNYKELCAVPSRDQHMDYIMIHEFGHFFGLNEEYEGGGQTELAFAPGIEEPWSQNITFLKDRSHGALKWKAFVLPATPLPTPREVWETRLLYGAYEGGYADSLPQHRSHKPGLSCVMERASDFCPVCKAALIENISRDLGITAN